MAKKKPTTKKKASTNRKPRPKTKRPVFGFSVPAKITDFDTSKIINP